ncbi:MAG: hypothetical protein N3I35_05230 [Clostridia bacterium]|nr:hypothetical protein [Clostridia bacterium]
MSSYTQAGRKTLLLIIFILLIDTLFYYVTDNTLTPASKMLRFFFSILLMFFIYRGHNWAKWFTGILLLLNSILCIVRIFFVYPSVSELFYSIFYVMLYGLAGYFLLSSRSIASFMNYQKSIKR